MYLIGSTGSELVEANGADVVELFETCDGLQRRNLVDGRAAPRESLPAGAGLAPQVEIGVQRHQHGPDGAAALEDQNERRIAQQKEAHQKL